MMLVMSFEEPADLGDCVVEGRKVDNGLHNGRVHPIMLGEVVSAGVSQLLTCDDKLPNSSLITSIDSGELFLWERPDVKVRCSSCSSRVFPRAGSHPSHLGRPASSYQLSQSRPEVSELGAREVVEAL